MEQWKDIHGYEGKYYISNYGNLMNSKGLIMKPMVCSNGYLTACLWRNNQQKKILIHRLVAIAFLENPNNLNEINHIDENKTNNNVENLEWCSHLYNMNYGGIRERIKKGRIGQTLSPEQRAKCALAALDKKWMHNNEKEILVKKDSVPSFLLDGWNLGRYKYVRES